MCFADLAVGRRVGRGVRALRAGPALWAGRRVRVARAGRAERAARRAAAMLLPGLTLLVAPALALAASPAPTSGDIGDPRSSGQGPGLVGDPLAAILLVALIAGLALGLTLLYVRATPGPEQEPPA